MFWLILFVVTLIVWVGFRHDEDEPLDWINGILCLIFGVTTLCMLFSGINTYPDLQKDKAEVIALQKRIKDIREATYKYTPSKTALVAGSIENFKQSETLSNYITQVVNYESDYAGNLAQAKVIVNSRVFWWFSYGAFISDNVLKMK